MSEKKTHDRETKAQLLKYAKEEFMEKGFAGASLRSICRKADVTTGALYFFFKDKDDLLNVVNWRKKSFPIHTSYTIPGEYGPGHNSFFTDDNGNVYIVYHAKEALKDAPRCTGIKLMDFDEDGEPYVVCR